MKLNEKEAGNGPLEKRKLFKFGYNMDQRWLDKRTTKLASNLSLKSNKFINGRETLRTKDPFQVSPNKGQKVTGAAAVTQPLTKTFDEQKSHQFHFWD